MGALRVRCSDRGRDNDDRESKWVSALARAGYGRFVGGRGVIASVEAGQGGEKEKEKRCTSKG